MYESDDARYLLINPADRTHQPRNYFVGCKSLYIVCRRLLGERWSLAIFDCPKGKKS